MTGADRAQIGSEGVSLLSVPVALKWATSQIDAAGIEQPRFEAQLLLAHALGVSRTAIVAGLRSDLSEAEFRAFEHLVHERARHVPFAYLRGTQEFYGLTFAVTPATLIPRPETELLVDFALEKLENCLVDVGTGSGCIPIAVLARCPHARAIAFDLSTEALAVARRNALALGVTERIRFVQGSMLTSAGSHVDVIVSNPPYIPTAEVACLQPEVRDFEPRLALDGGPDGLTFLRELAWEAPRVLKPGGWLAVEAALGQADVIAALFAANGLSDIAARRDFQGIERLIYGRTRK